MVIPLKTLRRGRELSDIYLVTQALMQSKTKVEAAKKLGVSRDTIGKICSKHPKELDPTLELWERTVKYKNRKVNCV